MEPTHVQINCQSALGPDTPIFINDDIINMTSLHLGFSGQRTKSLGINIHANYIVDECNILQVPEPMYVSSTVLLTLENGFHFECTPGTQIAVSNGFVRADSLSVGSKIYKIVFNSDNKEFYYNQELMVTDIQKSSIIQVNKPMYLIVSEFGNILLPHRVEGTNIIDFINLLQ